MSSAPLSHPSALPHHVAIIMDGNGRWANEQGLSRLEGHRAGARTVRRIVEAARRRGIRYLTLFSFSSENWRRSPTEISGLMRLFEENLESELETLLKNGVRLRAIGDLARLPGTVRRLLERNIRATAERAAASSDASDAGMDLVLALSYGGRQEIVEAARRVAERVQAGTLRPAQITEELFGGALWTADIPDPDLLIRTSGEMRVSNFLLWQLAYTEFVVVQKRWPEFDEADFDQALAEYVARERRYGQAVDRAAAVTT